MNQKQIDDILVFLHRTKGLETAKRYSASLKDMHNTVADHSWRLGLMALVIASEYKMEVDLGHVLALALIHDLAEAKTGDIDAYRQITEGEQVLKDKTASEETAMRDITNGLSLGDSVYGLWKEFEEQTTVEAKFVKALDRIEGFLHIAESGVEMYIPQEFHADYADYAVIAFDEATQSVPKLKDFLDIVKKDLKRQCKQAGIEWIDATIETDAKKP